MAEFKLKDQAFVIKGKLESDTYKGDISQGIAYDALDSKWPKVYRDGNYPLILTTYRNAAKMLVKHLQTKPDQKILEIGSGTGTCTLELLLQHPGIFVFGVEISEGMLQIARYKFNQLDKSQLPRIKEVTDEELLLYWENFRSESKRYRDKVEFILDDIQTTEKIKAESVDHAISSHSLHWTDLSKSFQRLNKFLKSGGQVIFSTSSHFYDDEKFKADKYDFRLNIFIKYVLEEVNKKVDINTDYSSLSKPMHNLSSFKDLALQEGFILEQIATDLDPVNLQVFIQNHLPAIIRQLNESKINEGTLELLIKDAIAKTINNPRALEDMDHKYAINTTFRLLKQKINIT